MIFDLFTKQKETQNTAAGPDYDYLARIRRMAALYTGKKTTNLLDGDFHSSYLGRSMEFEDLKEYSAGDNVRDIDWKASSRTGKVLVRRYEAEKRHHVMIVSDLNAMLQADTCKGEEKGELLLLLLGTIAYLSGRQGADYAFAGAPKGGIEISSFRSGPDHLEAALYRFRKAVGERSDTALPALLDSVMERPGNAGMLYILTDISGAEKLDDRVLRQLSIKYDIVLVLIQDAWFSQTDAYDADCQNRISRIFANKELRAQEEILRRNAAETIRARVKKYKGSVLEIAGAEDIIPGLIGLSERRRHGYFG